MSGTVFSAGQAAMVLFGVFIALLILRVPVAFALGLACLPVLLIEPRLSMMTLAQETFNAYNSFILLSVPFFLLDREPDEHRRHHRPAGRAVALDGRALAWVAGADQCRAERVLRRHLGFLDGGRREPVEDLHRCANQGGLRSFVLHRHHRGIGGARGHHPAVDPDDRVGRADLDLDRGDVSGRHHSRTIDRRRADGDRACLCGAPRLSDLSEGQLGADALRDLAIAPRFDDAVHHRRRHPARLVHGDGVGLRRRALFGCAIDVLLPGNRRQAIVQGLARHREARRGRAVLRRHRQRLRLALGLLQDPGSVAGQCLDLGHGTDRGGLLHRVLLSGGRMLPRRHSGHRDRRYRAGAAGPVGRPASGAICDHLDRLAGLRAGDPALWPVPDDRVFDRGRAAALRAQGHHDHAGADAGRAGGADRLAGACRCSCRA